MSAPPAIDVARCEALVERARSGDAPACRELIEHLWPHWVTLVRSSSTMRALGATDDHVHNVVARLVEKLGKPGGRALELFSVWRERHPGKDFGDWQRIVVKNAVRDYAREQLGSVRAPEGELSVKRLLNEFAVSPVVHELGVRPPITAAQTARELLEFAERRLPPDQLQALRAWLQGEGFDEQAGSELSSEAARKLVRAAVATLRRHFAPAEREP